MRFLCDTHREYLQRSEENAIEHWEQWMACAADKLAEEKSPEALRFLGCSYEVAQWLVESKAHNRTIDELTHIDRLVVSGHQLAQCLRDLNQHQSEWAILNSVHQILLELAITNHSSKMDNYLKLSTYMLKRLDQHRHHEGIRNHTMTFTISENNVQMH